MPFSTSFRRALLCLFLAMIIAQIGASLAKDCFALLTPSGVTFMRQFIGAILLFIFIRPKPSRIAKGSWKFVLCYGVVLGMMNLLFYFALARIPLGIAVGIEFTGPLVLAAATSRRLVDFLSIGLAAIGLVCLLPLDGANNANFEGVAFALAAAVCWASYILAGRRVSTSGDAAVAYGMFIASCCTFPLAFMDNGTHLFSLSVLPSALMVGIFAAALPFTLEMHAFHEVPPRLYGVLMSLEPAFAALMGFIILGEYLSLIQLIGIAFVMIASLTMTLCLRQ